MRAGLLWWNKKDTLLFRERTVRVDKKKIRSIIWLKWLITRAHGKVYGHSIRMPKYNGKLLQ